MPLSVLQRPNMVGSVCQSGGKSVTFSQHKGVEKLPTQSWTLLMILVLAVVMLFPFALNRLFISHLTILPTAEYTGWHSLPVTASSGTHSLSLPSSPSSPTNAHLQLQEDEKGGHVPAGSMIIKEEQQRQEDEKEEWPPKQLQVKHKTQGQQQHQRGVALDPIQMIDFSVGGCNIWKGKWVSHNAKPVYNNVTCSFIQGHQNCLKNGRPDHGYLHWKWKPDHCNLPPFNARKFLNLVHGKAWAFVGDSISRNHFQSFLCFLAQVEVPDNLFRDEKDLFVRWFFPSYNFTLAVFWSPFLVEWTEDEAMGFSAGIEKLHLDKVDLKWATSIGDFDYVVLSGGHWFLKSSAYFLNDELIGCHYCPGTNCTEMGFYDAFRTALRTTYDYLVSTGYQGMVFFRTFTPDHFENGQWHEGGSCMRTKPVHNATLGGITAEMYKVQLEEFGRTLQKVGSERRSHFKMADTIHASLVRPDGHPGPYRSIGSTASDLPQDCLHWCLPGPVDTWSAMLLEMLRRV